MRILMELQQWYDEKVTKCEEGKKRSWEILSYACVTHLADVTGVTNNRWMMTEGIFIYVCEMRRGKIQKISCFHHFLVESFKCSYAKRNVITFYLYQQKHLHFSIEFFWGIEKEAKNESISRVLEIAIERRIFGRFSIHKRERREKSFPPSLYRCVCFFFCYCS